MAMFATLRVQPYFQDGTILDRWITQEINKARGADSNFSFTSQNAVWTLNQDDTARTGGTFTLRFLTNQNFPSSAADWTTAAIAHNANAATIEAAIDTAANAASVSLWSDGDIAVTGGPLTTDDVVLTFDGLSVGNSDHDLFMTDSRTGGVAADPLFTLTTAGQGNRPAWAVLLAYDVVRVASRQAAVANTTQLVVGENPKRMPTAVIRELMKLTVPEDRNQGSYFSLQQALFPQDRAPTIMTQTAIDVTPSTLDN
jgi:hypothetical protein